MKAFELFPEQVAAIVGALTLDELAFRFRRQIDGMSFASTLFDAPLGADGLNLNDAERDGCALRAKEFFGWRDLDMAHGPTATLGGWSAALAHAGRRRLTELTFVAAGRGDQRVVARHAASDIFADAAAVSSLTYGRRRLLSFVSPHSLLGFTLTVLTPNLQQIEALDMRGMSPEKLNKTLSFGDVVVATPSLWRYLIQEGARAPDNVMAVYFGEAMSRELAKDMRDKGFSAQREVYGSTETGLIGWRDSPGEPFRLFEAMQREGDAVVRRFADGRSAPIETPDLIEWQEARTFNLGARRDGAVQIGAVNVFPDRIAAVIGAHEDVSTCRIEVGRHSGGFDRLIAHIELKEGSPLNERRARSIDRHCRDMLLPHERPRIYRFADGEAKDR
ncbi:MAG: hypothetical protein GC152_02595 [Alphaproteobacteria bacterium]|nr:hypothetical protein [Alphaproteobacteria bacterium]